MTTKTTTQFLHIPRLESLFHHHIEISKDQDEKVLAKDIAIRVNQIMAHVHQIEGDKLLYIEGYQPKLYKAAVEMLYERLSVSMAILADEFNELCYELMPQREATRLADSYALWLNAFCFSFFSSTFKVQPRKDGVESYYRFYSEDVDLGFWDKNKSLKEKTLKIKQTIDLPLVSWRRKKAELVKFLNEQANRSDDEPPPFDDLFGNLDDDGSSYFDLNEMYAQYEFLFANRVHNITTKYGLHKTNNPDLPSVADADFYVQKLLDEQVTFALNLYLNYEPPKQNSWKFWKK